MISSKKVGSPILLRILTPRLSKGAVGKLGKGKKTVLVLSTGRTGTNFIGKLFSRHPEVTALHEPRPSRIIRMWSIARIEGEATREDMAEVLFSKRRNLLASVNTPTYLESNPYLFGAADCLNDIFENPVIINIIRDPRDYVKSSLNHGNARGLKYLLNRFLPFWYPRTERILGLPNGESLIVKNAQYWRILNDWLENSLKDLNNYHVFRFEDLFYASDKCELKRLASTIGIADSFIDESDLSATNRSKDNAIASWREWSVDDCKKLEKLCRPIMDRYGYGKETEWIAKVGH